LGRVYENDPILEKCGFPSTLIVWKKFGGKGEVCSAQWKE